jgi:phosphoribosylformylglycinamidine synthase
MWSERRDQRVQFEIDADVDGKTKPYLLMFKTKHTTIRRKSNRSAVRQPVSAARSAIRFRGVLMSISPCASRLCGSDGADRLHHERQIPQRKITTQAASGFSSYGNQIGLCTGQVKEYYHPDFAAKRMEVGAVIAAAPKENVVRKSPVKGDIIYVIAAERDATASRRIGLVQGTQ